MSELDLFPLDPDYDLEPTLQSGILRNVAESGKQIARRKRADVRVFHLPFKDRPTDDIEQLRDWISRFHDKPFVFDHKVWVDNSGAFLPRYFPVRFMDDEQSLGRLLANQSHSCTLRLVEAVGDPLIGNYLSAFADLANAAWTKNQCSVAGFIDAPGAFPGYRAQRLSPNVGATDAYALQEVLTLPLVAAQSVHGKVWLRAQAGTPSINITLRKSSLASIASQTCALTTSWQEFTVASGSLPADTLGVVLTVGGDGSWVEADGAVDVFIESTKGLTYNTTTRIYPAPGDGHPTAFIDETDGAALAGTWTLAANANARLGKHRSNANSNATDAFQFIYSGYGFALVAERSSAYGIAKIYLDGVEVGRLDLYATSAQPAGRVFERWNVPLGLHRVKIEATNTKNSAASANTIVADAVEFMP